MKYKKLFFISLLFVSFINMAQEIDIDRALTIATNRLLKSDSVITDTNKFPRSFDQYGKMLLVHSGDWTSGFYPGCLWYAYEFTKDDRIKQIAEKWTARLENEKYHKFDHDIGFIMYCSYGNGYRLTHNPKYKEILIESAKSCISRYSKKVGLIKSWDHLKKKGYFYPVIIDNMMNLELLYWASKTTRNPEYKLVANNHALNTSRNQLRADFSTYHVVEYDTNAFSKKIKGFTVQGFNDTSCWARGQAWGIYSFPMCYRETGDKRYLVTAQKLAKYFIDNLPQDGVPYWDFNAPKIPNEERDASAGAIAANGLLMMSQFDYYSFADRTMYLNIAKKILASLTTDQYLNPNPAFGAVLLHSVGGKTYNGEVDYSINYGDYYLMEALLRLKNLDPISNHKPISKAAKNHKNNTKKSVHKKKSKVYSNKKKNSKK